MTHDIARQKAVALPAIWGIATVYGLASNFFTANFYSWGLTLPFNALIVSILLISPFFGFAALSIEAVILRWVGRWFGGKAEFASIREALAMSKLPALALCLMWACLIGFKPDIAFIHNVSNGVTVLIVFNSLACRSGSFLWLVRGMRSVQAFSRLRAFLYVAVFYLLSFSLYIYSLYIARYVYIYCF